MQFFPLIKHYADDERKVRTKGPVVLSEDAEEESALHG
jgi:hypothetical protein